MANAVVARLYHSKDHYKPSQRLRLVRPSTIVGESKVSGRFAGDDSDND
jgi:hypothetical protein